MLRMGFGGHMKRAGVRILLVEDEVEVAETVSDLLTALGHEVAVANDAETAIKLLREVPPFQVLVSDIVMPGLSGAELAMEARRIAKDIRVVLTSGYSASVVESARREVPGCCYLPKPYSMKELSDVVEACLGRSDPVQTQAIPTGGA